MNQYTEDFILRIVQMKNSMKSVSELCDELVPRTQTIYVWCNNYNSPQENY